MGEAFRLGGWGMIPTTIIGLLLVGAAARFAWRPDRHGLRLIIWMQVLTLLVGALGFISGMIKASLFAGETPAPTDAVIHGFGEALHNVALALALVITAGIIGALGLARRKRVAAAAPGDGALVDPFA